MFLEQLPVVGSVCLVETLTAISPLKYKNYLLVVVIDYVMSCDISLYNL
jgi:hypothetical protein